jgi:hypothetical protein
MRRLSLVALGFVAAIWSLPSLADEPFLATLELDPFSIVSFGDQDVYPLPEGSKIVFEFSSSSGKRSLRFVVRPSEALLTPIPLRHADESLQFSLARTATGTMRRGEDGRLIVEISADVVVALDHPDEPGWKRLPILLTTEAATARSQNGAHRIDVSGGRVAGRGVQLVGVATNAGDDYPKPGAAVYVVLSGVFDRLPTLE